MNHNTLKSLTPNEDKRWREHTRLVIGGFLYGMNKDELKQVCSTLRALAYAHKSIHIHPLTWRTQAEMRYMMKTMLVAAAVHGDGAAHDMIGRISERLSRRVMLRQESLRRWRTLLGQELSEPLDVGAVERHPDVKAALRELNKAIAQDAEWAAILSRDREWYTSHTFGL